MEDLPLRAVSHARHTGKSPSRERSPGLGLDAECRVDVAVEFFDEDGDAVEVESLSYGIEAKVLAGAEVGSVALSLSGAKSASATESKAPYSLYGDRKDANGTRVLNGGTLPAGSYTLTATAYAESGGVGAMLGTRTVSFTVLGAPALSVADDSAEEGTDASLDFVVTLDRRARETVTVAYATSDGTAAAGEDYTATSDTLTFQPGETTKMVSVTVLDDAIDEGRETMTLTLSGAEGAVIADGEAEGTISNSDPLQKMWLARFGRTVGSQVVDAVSERLEGPPAGAEVTIGGQTLDLAREDDEALLAAQLTGVARAFGGDKVRGPDGGLSGSGTWRGEGGGAWGEPWSAGSSRSMSGREALLGSASHLASNRDRAGPGFAAWGRITVGGFDAEEERDGGAVRMDGEVTTGVLGADASWRHWLAGVAVSASEGEGTFDYAGADVQGTVESSLTGVHPYARVRLGERVDAWGLLGFGTGAMTMTQEANATRARVVTRTDVEMRLAAAGARGALLEAGQAGGMDLALKADAFIVEMESEKAANTVATGADASRVRLGLEGRRSFETGGSAAFTPGLEVGLRHDGGDAETGSGVEAGASVAFAGAGSGLTMEARVRTLIAYEDGAYEEWGASGSVRLEPGASGRGLAFTLAPSWGAASSGLERLWSAGDARGVVPGAEFEPESRLDAEIGYGLRVGGDGFTGTPCAGLGLSQSGRDWRIGYRFVSTRREALDLELGLEGTRRENTNDDTPPEHGLIIRGAVRW